MRERHHWSDISRWFTSTSSVPCTGFGAFFAVFDITRRVAMEAGIASQSVAFRFFPTKRQSQRRLQRVVHSLTLVIGGVAAGISYEVVSRPWNNARKAVERNQFAHMSQYRSASLAVLQALRTDGLRAFFRDPAATTYPATGRNRRMAILRTLGRVGPWGLGFLVWEGLGPGLP